MGDLADPATYQRNGREVADLVNEVVLRTLSGGLLLFDARAARKKRGGP